MHERPHATLQYLQLMTRTFSALRLTERRAICDTVSALIGSFFDCRVRLALLRGPASGSLVVQACEGVEAAALESDAARSLWAWAMAERLPRALDGEQLRARWPAAPPALAQPFACVAIDLHDVAIGVLAFADPRGGQAFDDQQLEFLLAATGLASMALANAEAYELVDEQRRVAETRAAQAAAEARDKQAALDVIAAQQRQINALMTPILRLHRDVLALPIIGSLDAARSEAMQASVLAEIVRLQTRFLIVDVTGVELLDTRGADQLLRLTRCARLLGTTCIVTGMAPAVAQTLVALGVEFDSLLTRATLGDGFEACLRLLAQRNV